MTTRRTISRNTRFSTKLGDEDTNEACLSAIRQAIGDTDDRILNHTTFDFGSKALALTLQGVILADADEIDDNGSPSVALASYADILRIENTGHDREIRLVLRDGDAVTWRMGHRDTINAVKELLRGYRLQFYNTGDPQLWQSADAESYEDASSTAGQESNNDDETMRIGERVQFWQEQDQINQALIPRVIAQGELLSQHIVEHDDLPRMVSDTVQSALLQQSQRFTEQVEQLQTEHAEQLRTVADEAIAKMQQETAETVSSLQDAHDALAGDNRRLEADLRKTRLRLTIAVGVGIVLGIASITIAVI